MLLALAGCAQTATASTTLAPLPVISTAPPSTVFVPPPSVEGYVNGVVDGMSFTYTTDPSLPNQSGRLTHITLPPAGTCEAAAARDLLASIIFGHKIRIDPDDSVWLNDVNVARAMVAYGRAKAADDVYAADDAASPDVVCGTTTTTTVPVVVAPPPAAPAPPKPKPKPVTTPRPTTPPPAETSPRETTPATEPAPVVTEPPPEPVQTFRHRPPKHQHS